MMVPLVLNLFLNAWIGFWLTFALVELVLWIIRIRHPRLQFWARLLPFVKVLTDLLRYDLTHWAVKLGKSPLDAPVGTRSVSAWIGTSPGMGLSAQLNSGELFSPADLLWYWLPQGVSLAVVALLLAGSLIALTQLIWRSAANRRNQIHLLRTATPLEPSLYSSSEIATPMTWGVWRPVILVPEEFWAELSPGEQEAILHHEREHARWRDPLAQLLVALAGILLWWCPFFRRARRRLFLCQEQACDRGWPRSESDPLDMASALSKAAQAGPQALPGTPLVGREGSCLLRVRSLLGPLPKRDRWVQWLLLAAGLGLLARAGYWIV